MVITLLLVDDSIPYPLWFKPVVFFQQHRLSDNPVDILLFDKTFLETDMAQSMIFGGDRSLEVHNWTMTVDQHYK